MLLAGFYPHHLPLFPSPIPAAFPAPVPVADLTAPCPEQTTAAPAEQPSFEGTWDKTSTAPGSTSAHRKTPVAPLPSLKAPAIPGDTNFARGRGQGTTGGSRGATPGQGRHLAGRGGGPGVRRGSAPRSLQAIAFGRPPAGAGRGHGAPREEVRDGDGTGRGGTAPPPGSPQAPLAARRKVGGGAFGEPISGRAGVRGWGARARRP